MPFDSKFGSNRNSDFSNNIASSHLKFLEEVVKLKISYNAFVDNSYLCDCEMVNVYIGTCMSLG